VAICSDRNGSGGPETAGSGWGMAIDGAQELNMAELRSTLHRHFDNDR
jgi:hypothetical protein